MSDTAGRVLEHDHHRIDELFAAFTASLAGDKIDAAAFLDGAAALRHHIYVEEELHFPALRAAGLLAPILVMLREHGEMWDLLDAITSALETNADDITRTSWPVLAQLIEAHNAKEEQIIYPAGDQTLTAEAADDVISFLTSEETPPGWTCQLAGRGQG